MKTFVYMYSTFDGAEPHFIDDHLDMSIRKFQMNSIRHKTDELKSWFIDELKTKSISLQHFNKYYKLGVFIPSDSNFPITNRIEYVDFDDALQEINIFELIDSLADILTLRFIIEVKMATRPLIYFKEVIEYEVYDKSHLNNACNMHTALNFVKDNSKLSKYNSGRVIKFINEDGSENFVNHLKRNVDIDHLLVARNLLPTKEAVFDYTDGRSEGAYRNKDDVYNTKIIKLNQGEANAVKSLCGVGICNKYVSSISNTSDMHLKVIKELMSMDYSEDDYIELSGESLSDIRLTDGLELFVTEAIQDKSLLVALSVLEFNNYSSNSITKILSINDAVPSISIGTLSYIVNHLEDGAVLNMNIQYDVICKFKAATIYKLSGVTYIANRFGKSVIKSYEYQNLKDVIQNLVFDIASYVPTDCKIEIEACNDSLCLDPAEINNLVSDSQYNYSNKISYRKSNFIKIEPIERVYDVNALFEIDFEKLNKMDYPILGINNAISNCGYRILSQTETCRDKAYIIEIGEEYKHE